MSRFRRKHPQTAARRDRTDGRTPTVRARGYLPTERDDLHTRLQRSWKKFRKTRYRPSSGQQATPRRGRAMARGMGRGSLTDKAWKAQKCFAVDVRHIGRAARRRAKPSNAMALRRRGRQEARDGGG